MKSKLKRVNGVLKIDIDGEIIEPLSFKSFRPTAKNISDFQKAGVRLFSILSSGLYSILGVPYSLYGENWLGKGEYDFGVIDRQIELFQKNAPGCYFTLMIQLDTRDWWLKSHENFPNSFTHLSQMASNEEWRIEATKYLQAVLTHVEEKYGDIMYGYFLLCGTTTEWFSERDYEASHPFKEEYFKKYTNNPHAIIPDEKDLILPENISFNDNKNVKLYRQAHAEQTADTILYFAAKAQEVIKHRKLLGLYFGYLFELQGERLWNTGHLAYEKVFFSDDIDMISSPSSYEYRGIASTSAFMTTYKTLDIHNMLYYLEFDHITHLAPAHIEGFTIPGGKNKCKDQTETLNLMQRDFMLCVANGAALWWFDMFEGWFYSDEMMGTIKDMIEIAKKMSKLTQESIAEIAVISSGTSLYGVNKKSEINDRLLGRQRDGLARMGAPYDIYTNEDVLNIDTDKYKLFIFLDMLETTPKQEEFIGKIKTLNKTLLYLYAPGFINGGIDSIKRITEMDIEILTDEVRSVNCEAELMTKPNFKIVDKDAVTLAEYNTSDMAIGYKVFDDHISVYSAVGNLGGDILRKIAKLSGVFIYSETAPVYVNSNVIGVYAMNECTLNVKKDGLYVNLFSGKEYKSFAKTLTISDGALYSKLLVLKENI